MSFIQEPGTYQLISKCKWKCHFILIQKFLKFMSFLFIIHSLQRFFFRLPHMHGFPKVLHWNKLIFYFYVPRNFLEYTHMLYCLVQGSLEEDEQKFGEHKGKGKSWTCSVDRTTEAWTQAQRNGPLVHTSPNLRPGLQKYRAEAIPFERKEEALLTAAPSARQPRARWSPVPEPHTEPPGSFWSYHSIPWVREDPMVPSVASVWFIAPYIIILISSPLLTQSFPNNQQVPDEPDLPDAST